MAHREFRWWLICAELGYESIGHGWGRKWSDACGKVGFLIFFSLAGSVAGAMIAVTETVDSDFGEAQLWLGLFMSKGVIDPKLVNCFIASLWVAKGARMDTFESLSRLQRPVVF